MIRFSFLCRSQLTLQCSDFIDPAFDTGFICTVVLCHSLHLRLSVPLIGLLFCGNASAYAYILESLKHYPAQLAVAEKMRKLKLNNVRVVNLLGGAMAINFGEKPQ